MQRISNVKVNVLLINVVVEKCVVVHIFVKVDVQLVEPKRTKTYNVQALNVQMMNAVKKHSKNPNVILAIKHKQNARRHLPIPRKHNHLHVQD
jgi:hypothetical protein